MPAAPSQLRRLLRGDLDNIVRKALHARPEQRYPSATALIEDIERHLQGRPVLAHPPSRWYVLGKFLRRNRIAVALAGALLLAVVGSLAGALYAIGMPTERMAEEHRTIDREGAFSDVSSRKDRAFRRKQPA